MVRLPRKPSGRKQQTGWHAQEAPFFAWMLAGELTVDYGLDGSRVYRAGAALIEAFRTRHNGRNSGAEEVGFEPTEGLHPRRFSSSSRP